VLCHENRAVSGFLEKPAPSRLRGIDRYFISAGIYVLEPSVLDMIPSGQEVSIEREVWPALVGNGLHGSQAEGAYWMDIGTPERYLQGTFDILEGNVRTAAVERIGAGVTIAPDAQVGSLVVLGPGVTIGEGARVERSVVLDGVSVGAGAELTDCIVAAGATIAEGAVVRGGAVIGEGVRVGPGNVLTAGIKVFPDTDLAAGSIKF